MIIHGYNRPNIISMRTIYCISRYKSINCYKSIKRALKRAQKMLCDVSWTEWKNYGQKISKFEHGEINEEI